MTEIDVDLEALTDLRAASLAALSKFREPIESGPFLFLRNPDSELIFSNYAVPLVRTTVDDLVRLAELMRASERTPRIEYFHELNPEIRSNLVDAGWVEERSDPVMALTPHDVVPRPTPNVVAVESLEACVAADSVATEAFGEMGGSEQPGVAAWKGIQRGTWVALNALVDGVAVSTGGLQGDTPIPELCGVATRVAYRGQGYAAQVCTALCERHFASGGEGVWLSASADGRKLYANVGFRTVGTQVNASASLR